MLDHACRPPGRWLPGRTFRNPTLVRRIMHINELTTDLCIIMSVHVTMF